MRVLITGASGSGTAIAARVPAERYLLTVTLAPTPDGGTPVHWRQAFEDADLARRMERIVVPANDEVLDRLAAEVLSR